MELSQPKTITYTESAALLERARQVLAGGVSSEFRKYNHPHAIFYTHGLGSRIYDVDGNEYLDFTLSQGPLLLGHSHPEVLQAVQEYSEQGQLFAGQHLREIKLAEKLVQLIPSAELLRFCLDGSEAVQTALRVARAKTGRQKFLRFEGHYHGWLDNVAWGFSAPSLEALGERDNPTVFPWSQGLATNSRDEFSVLPWNDLALVEEFVARNHQELAAIITEPIMCNNGCILPEPAFLPGLRNLCDQYGIALIFDEVITGFRVGLGGAQQFYDVTPDLSIFAKALASGYPISAVVGKRDWMKRIEDGSVIHAGTMNAGNPTVAAALATLKVLEREQPHQRLYQYGWQLMAGLQQAAADTGQNLQIQGLGPMFSTVFTDSAPARDYRGTLANDKAKLSRFIAGLHNRGVRVIGRGLWYISAAHTQADIDQAIQTATDVLKTL
ncbi:glutamate-1-semialdehyde 2,1-aminomutase [Larkinella knui]|uniref:Aspartate aminotransferase family protein n=1 Tax=Larkinella knui TaxID=2025310 RepID=A0A3P1CNS3_9BACT|nr:aspartate aminotransferase family protein [Larkinella knui]RRB14878.1 aspartate aminotransferase family protein [Larkinella knui]